MSRRRDTNWSRDEITVLLDSITEITRLRADDGKRTNSREVFEYAAKKMGERGHVSRAEREKCRTKWKKMKEEFTHAKRARDGDSRFKEAPGIQPFYDRMEEFINGTFDNISPHSTIVRRTSSLSSSSGNGSSSLGYSRQSSGMRTSARLAANTNGVPSNDPKVDITVTNLSRTNSGSSEYQSNQIASSAPSASSRQNSSRHSSSSSSNNTISSRSSIVDIIDSNINIGKQQNQMTTESNSSTINITGDTGNSNVSNTVSNAILSTNASSTTIAAPLQSHNQPKANTNSEVCTIHTSYRKNNPISTTTNVSTISNAMNNNDSVATGHHFSNLQMLSDTTPVPLASADHADISYRVSTGCRQITIFGDHDVDIKFRGDCVTINKINTDYPTATEI